MWKNILLGLAALLAVFASLFASRNKDIAKDLDRLKDSILDTEASLNGQKEQAVAKQAEVTEAVQNVELDIKAVHEKAQEDMAAIEQESTSADSMNEFMGKRK